MSDTRTMTADEARTFEAGEREASVERVAQAIQSRQAHGAHPPECCCMPYVDTFTGGRWKAQGFQMRKGTKGFALKTWRPVDDDDDKTRRKMIRTTSYIFCRCQVASEKNQPWAWTVPDELLTEGQRNGKRHPKSERDRTPKPPADELQKWIEQLMHEANHDAPEGLQTVGVQSMAEIDTLGRTHGTRARLAILAHTADPLGVADKAYRVLDAGGVAVALVREPTPDERAKLDAVPMIQTVDVGEVTIHEHRARCAVLRIAKAA